MHSPFNLWGLKLIQKAVFHSYLERNNDNSEITLKEESRDSSASVAFITVILPGLNNRKLHIFELIHPSTFKQYSSLSVLSPSIPQRGTRRPRRFLLTEGWMGWDGMGWSVNFFFFAHILKTTTYFFLIVSVP